MAGYFSNHSRFRFLPNPPNSTTPPASQSSSQKQPLPSSKHFSTSVSTAESQAKDRVANSSGTPVDEPPSSVVHPLRNTWVFWYRQQRSPGRITNYEEGIKKVSAFSSVESFWSLWTHLNPPSALQPTTDYLLFHSGIRRAVWEDPLNIQGGKWIIRLKKGVADRLWELLVLAVIGDQFDERTTLIGEGENSADDGSSGSGDWPEICGCTISVRQSEDIVSLWNRVEEDVKLRERIRETLRKVLNLPTSTIMEYKSNNDSIQDKSSFRSAAVDRPFPP